MARQSSQLVLLFEQSSCGLFKQGKLALDDIPDELRINARVLVNEHIAQPTYPFPLHIRAQRANVFANDLIVRWHG